MQELPAVAADNGKIQLTVPSQCFVTLTAGK
jgi:hypothetical protein